MLWIRFLFEITDILRLPYKNRICQRRCFCPKHNSDLNCDMVLCYHRKIRPLIVLFYCRYHNIFEPLINTVMAAISNWDPFSISWRYQKFRFKWHHPNIWYKLTMKKTWTFNVSPRFLFHGSKWTMIAGFYSFKIGSLTDSANLFSYLRF